MRNREKFVTAQERAEAFEKFCNSFGEGSCKGCPILKCDTSEECEFTWLDLEAEEEKPLPCPFCGSECELLGVEGEDWKVLCMNSKGPCYYTSAFKQTKEDAIAAHNRVAKAVRESEERHE